MKRFTSLTSADAVTLFFITSLSLIELIFASRIDQWILFVSLNIVLILCVYFSALHVHHHHAQSNAVIRFFHDWYLVPCILFVYTQASSITHHIHGRDYDTILIMIDRAVFGVDPTLWITQFTHPILTEILQITYASYYLFFIALFYELYRRNDHSDFRSGALLVVYGFYLSYLGYLLFPAIGPRFTLHDFYLNDKELPGLFLTDYLRTIINAGGGIPAGVTDPAQYVHRDAFPSGHTQLTLVAMYVAFSARTNIRWWLFVGGTLLIISTIYMRYHYVVDVVAGMIFFIFTIWSGKMLDKWWTISINEKKAL